MDKIELTLHSSGYGDMEIKLLPKTDNDYFNVPTGKELVYNDNDYHFYIRKFSNLPTKVYINDELYEIEVIDNDVNAIKFKLKYGDKPFLYSFGAVKIEMDIGDQTFTSNSITVMVSNTEINNSVMNMILYIYDNCEKYLYEEHKHATITTGIKDSVIISLEAKIAFLINTLKIYKHAYHYLRTNSYSKLEKAETVDSFDKLQSISSNTIRYIATHTDELVAVNYNSGIRYIRKYYQPNRTLVEYNSYSFDIYENQIIVGFLRTVVKEITQIIKTIQARSYTQSKVVIKEGYIDSMYEIFSRSIKKINSYIQELTKLKEEYSQLYFCYVKLFNVQGIELNHVPVFTSVFRSNNLYRQIYQAIYDWFHCGNYDLGKEDLLLSFISTSKIYEYYCLIKLLYYLDQKTNLKFTAAKRLTYKVWNNYYTDTRYNNCFIFERENQKLTFYFQPIIYGNGSAKNGIRLFRNTSSNSKIGCENKGKTYMPDYIIKMDVGNHSEYLIMDAKFSTPKNIRNYQLQELVYKYLFSISTLDEQDVIKGLYIICGKTLNNDKEDVIHDIARHINQTVSPFAELLVMNGKNTKDDYIPSLLFKDICNCNHNKTALPVKGQ